MHGSGIRRTGVLALGISALVVAAAACAPQENEPSSGASSTASAGSSCAKKDLKTQVAGKLTIATDQPVYQPWFEDDKPENGKGFEGAVAYAVAEKMGFTKAEVVWKRTKFNAAIAPGPKDFDFDINEFSINDQRKKAVDFSSSYYDVTQAIIALDKSKIANAKSLADLKDATLGAQVNTTSYDAITDVIKPSTDPQAFPNNDNAKRALQNGTIDGLVVDLPTAFYMTSAEIEGSKIVGQVEVTKGTPEQFGLVLDKGSPLTACVSKAVDALRGDKTLDTLETQWLAGDTTAPVLQ